MHVAVRLAAQRQAQVDGMPSGSNASRLRAAFECGYDSDLEFGDAAKRRPFREGRFEQGETAVGDKGKKDKGRKEVQKKAKLSPKEKRQKKKEKKNA